MELDVRFCHHGERWWILHASICVVRVRCGVEFLRRYLRCLFCMGQSRGCTSDNYAQALDSMLCWNVAGQYLLVYYWQLICTFLTYWKPLDSVAHAYMLFIVFRHYSFPRLVMFTNDPFEGWDKCARTLCTNWLWNLYARICLEWKPTLRPEQFSNDPCEGCHKCDRALRTFLDNIQCLRMV